MNINGVEQIPIVSLYQINKFVSNKIVKKKILNEFTMTLKKDEFLLINYKDPQEIIAFNNIISGIDNDYSGHTYLLGAYLPALNNSQRAFLRANLLGFIFRENKFFENYTVFENLLYSFSYKNYNINKIKDKIIKLVLYIGIERYLNKKIKEIPIDLLIKVAFIRVLIKNLHLLLPIIQVIMFKKKN